jgi:hypothetical protein
MVGHVQGRGATRILNAVAHCALYALLAAISSGHSLAQGDGESPNRYSVYSRNAFYEVLESPSEEGRKCLYRDQTQLLCPGTAFIAFEKHYKTKDYDLLVISMGELGSGTRWWDWKLIVDDGKQAIIKPLADGCLECDIQVERLNSRSNEIVFVYRQQKHRITARFHEGQLTTQKSKLDPHEPLDEETCDALFGSFEECRSSTSCRMTLALSNASRFGVLRTEDRYAGISVEGLDRLCKAACSNGKTMNRTTFFKKVCRR